MGVTTEITGEGESVAPINERQIKEQEYFLKRFNLTIDWRTLDEYFKRLEKQRTGLNLGTFVGATQIREYVIGYDNRPPTPAELETMKKLVADAMRDGALGLSTSLQYIPARFATTDEIVELAKVAKQYGGIYATHQRSEATRLMNRFRKYLRLPAVQISPLKSGTSRRRTKRIGVECRRYSTGSNRHVLGVSM